MESIGSLVYAFMRAMHRNDAGRTMPILHAARLTAPQLAVLESAHEPRTVSAIATYLGLSRPAASQLIDKLVRSRLLRRAESAADRRQRNVILTPKGKLLVERIADARAARFDASLATLAPATAAKFESILGEVIHALREAGR